MALRVPPQVWVPAFRTRIVPGQCDHGWLLCKGRERAIASRAHRTIQIALEQTETPHLPQAEQ